MIIVETQRLILRQFDRPDLTALIRVFGDPQVMRFGDGPQTPEWVHGWLGRALDSYEERGFGPWAVVEKAGSGVIGYCGLFYFPDVNGRPEVELGYRLAHTWWGRGYATEAAIAARDYAFTILRLPRLIALIDPANVASVRVAQKVGMRHEAEAMLAGYDHPDLIYVCLNSTSGI